MKRKIKHYLQTRIVPFIMQLIVRLIYLTNKRVFHYRKIDQDATYIVAFWHGDLLMQIFNYKKLRPNNKIRAMISEHRDGETISKIIEYLGIGTISGSSTRGGAKAFINGLRTLKKGVDVAITPDGPKGPIYSVADGIVVMSKKSKSKILPFASKPTKYWQFKSWDKFIVPKPFGTIHFYAGEPFDVDGLEMDEAKELISLKLKQNQLEK